MHPSWLSAGVGEEISLIRPVFRIQAFATTHTGKSPNPMVELPPHRGDLKEPLTWRLSRTCIVIL